MLGLVLKTGANCHAWDVDLGVNWKFCNKSNEKSAGGPTADRHVLSPFFPAASIQQGPSSSRSCHHSARFIKLIGTCRHTSKGLLPGEINITFWAQVQQHS